MRTEVRLCSLMNNGGGMLYPVDFLSNESYDDLEEEAGKYQHSLLFDNPCEPTTLKLNNGHTILISSVTTSFVPLFANCTERKVLALFSPEDKYTASAIYLQRKWWTVEDILRTSDYSRKGLVPVKSMGEHIVLYVLNRIVYRTREMEPGGGTFLLHSSDDIASVMWRDGEAVGFYTIKAKATLCTYFVNQCYELHVLDSIFVRQAWRRRGFALRMLEDYVNKFDDEQLGIRFPLSAAMYQVCKKHLELHPSDRDFLWEVTGQGKLFHHENIWKCLQQTRKNELAFGSSESDICFPEGTPVTVLPRLALKCTAKKSSMQVVGGLIASTPQKPPVVASLCGGDEEMPGPSLRLGHKAELHMDDSTDCTDCPLDGRPSSSSAKWRKGHSEEASVQEDLVNEKTVAHPADNQGAETHCETLLEKQNGSSLLAQMSQHAVDISGEMSLKLSNLSSTASQKEDGKKAAFAHETASARSMLCAEKCHDRTMEAREN